MGYVALALAVAALWLSLLYSQLHKENQRWRLAYLRALQRHGAPRDGGSLKPSASTSTKEHGTTPTHLTKAVSNFLQRPGPEWAAPSTTVVKRDCYTTGIRTLSTEPLIGGRRLLDLVNSYSGHGLSIDATATPGVSGVPLGRVV